MNFERGMIGSADDFDDEAVTRGRRRRVAIVLLAIAVALAVLFFALRGGKAPPPAAPSLPRITVVVPGRQSVTASVSANGTIAARREMPVGVAGEGGIVTRVLVDAGDWVKAGQTLATVERSVQSQQAAQMSAQAGVAQADARMAQLDLERAQKLLGRGFVSQAMIDQKTATRDAANARVKLARAQVGEMGARLGRLDIRAPSDGLVLARSVEPGQIVSSGTQALFRIAQHGNLEMRAQLAEEDLARLRVGSPAMVTPVGSTSGFAGSVWQLSPTIDPTSRQGIARVAVPYNPALRPGGFASAELQGGAGVAPLLPESAVLSDQRGNYVYIVGPGDRVVRRDVKVGDVNDRGVVVTKGLAGTERVVASAGAFLNPGDKVIPTTAAAS